MDPDDWLLLHKVANDPPMLALLFVLVFCGGWGVIFAVRAVLRRLGYRIDG